MPLTPPRPAAPLALAEGAQVHTPGQVARASQQPREDVATARQALWPKGRSLGASCLARPQGSSCEMTPGMWLRGQQSTNPHVQPAREHLIFWRGVWVHFLPPGAARLSICAVANGRPSGKAPGIRPLGQVASRNVRG